MDMKKDKRHGEVEIIDGKVHLWTSQGFKHSQTEKNFNVVRTEKWIYKGATYYPHVKLGYPKVKAVRVEGKYTQDE